MSADRPGVPGGGVEAVDGQPRAEPDPLIGAHRVQPDRGGPGDPHLVSGPLTGPDQDDPQLIALAEQRPERGVGEVVQEHPVRVAVRHGRAERPIQCAELAAPAVLVGIQPLAGLQVGEGGPGDAAAGPATVAARDRSDAEPVIAGKAVRRDAAGGLRQRPVPAVTGARQQDPQVELQRQRSSRALLRRAIRSRQIAAERRPPTRTVLRNRHAPILVGRTDRVLLSVGCTASATELRRRPPNREGVWQR